MALDGMPIRAVGAQIGKESLFRRALEAATADTGEPPLARIEPHRLRALILEDLARYPGSASSDINGRVGPELSVKTIKRALDELVATGQVDHEGDRRWRRYRLGSKGQTAGESEAGR